jgi:hypothetical protein
MGFKISTLFFVLISLFSFSCNRLFNSPYDSATSPELWKPTSMELIVDATNSVKITWEQTDKRIDGFVLINNNYPNSSSFIIAKDQNIFTDNSTFMIQNCGFNFDYSLKAFAGNNESSPTRYYNCLDTLTGGSGTIDPADTNSSLATISSTSLSSITQTSAQITAEVLYSGGATVSARGVCYSTSQNPTTANSLFNSGSGTGIFTSNITGLTPNTTYYIRAFANNSAGTAYGNEVNFKTMQLPNTTCNVTATTTGTNFTMQTIQQSYFNQSDAYTITMYSSVYSFGQAATSALYDGNVYVYSFGNWLLFTNNARTFTLPNSIPSSNCYNIRITKGSDLYVSPTFIIVP